MCQPECEKAGARLMGVLRESLLVMKVEKKVGKYVGDFRTGIFKDSAAADDE